MNRPPVSNLEMLVVVFAAADPEPNMPVIDKLVASCEAKSIEVALCVSKKDLVSEIRTSELIDRFYGLYPIVAIDGISGEGIDELSHIIAGKNVALAGPSGVGKSTITNFFLKDRKPVATGSVSDKTSRGRHTTRHVEIFTLEDGTLLYDTPGFTSLDMPNMSEMAVQELFPEMKNLRRECKFADCIHINEPECAIKAALKAGDIDKSRYDSYLMMIEEVKKWHK